MSLRDVLRRALTFFPRRLAAAYRARMDHKTVSRLLDPEKGLRCLPWFVKKDLGELCVKLGTWQERVLGPRLRFVERYVEPVAAAPGAGGHPDFADLCQLLSETIGLRHVAALLDVRMPEDDPSEEGDSTWARWAVQTQESRPEQVLYCSTNAWVSQVGGSIADLDALFLTSAADLLRQLSRPELACHALETWLALSVGHYSDRLGLAQRLTQSRLSQLVHAGIRLGVLRALAQVLLLAPERGPQHATRLLHAGLGIPDDAYGDMGRLKAALRTLPSHRFGDWGFSPSACDVLRVLMEALSQTEGHGPAHAWELLLVWLEIGQDWQQSAGKDDLEAFEVSDLLVGHTSHVRDRLATFPERQDYLSNVGPLWAHFLSVGLARASQAREDRQDKEADRLEQRLLAWAEQFENRLLVERMLDLRGRSGHEGASLPDGWGPGSWALPRHVAPPGPGQFYDGYLPPADPFAWPQSVLAALESRPDAGPETERPETRGDPDPDIREQRDRLARQVAGQVELSQLVPPGAVWVRTLFESDGALRWWAQRRTGPGLEILARGRSEPRAWQRLQAATQAFDLAVERVWLAYQTQGADSPLDLATRQALTALCQMLSDEAYSKEQLGATSPGREEFIRTLLGAAWELGLLRPRLGAAAMASVLNLQLPEQGRLQPIETRASWLTALAEGVDALSRPWQEPFGSQEREVRRRRDLDAATETYLQAVQRELSLGPLWQAGLDRVTWEQTDFLLQVQGSLLAAPLAWIDFGGQPLFRRVASTTTVISLALRRLFELEAGSAGPPSRRLLSAHWLEPEDWERMGGLANLHAGLQRVGARHDWETWGLGQEPMASVGHLRAALGRTDRPFSVAVVGGHGVRHQSGVALADGVWCGDGTDLGRLDLLLLAACAAGQLKEQNERDVEGLYVQLAAHGCRCVVAARWPIADTEAATFATEVIDQYLQGPPSGKPATPFARARAFNRARRRLLDHPDPAARVSFHLTAAFDIYGLG